MRARSIISIVGGLLAISPAPLGAIQATGVSALAGASILLSEPAGSSGVPHPPQVQRVGETGPGTVSSAASTRMLAMTTAEASTYLRNTQGRVSVVIIYSTDCPRSRSMFPGFVVLANRYAGKNVAFTAIDVARDDGGLLPQFLARYNAPFEPLHIREEAAADNHMGRDLAPFGIRLNETYYLPFTAVLDRSGNAVAQWDGTPSLRAVDAAIRAQL
jgi:thiol-disulfide isomerase/thioredoxin